MPTLPKVRSISIRESAVEALRTALFERRFKPGEPLSEARLAAEMNISRGPVREALFTLEQDGLVTHSQNRGFSVVQFTEKDHEEIWQVRYPLEALALELARAQVTTQDLKILRQLTAKMSEEYLKRNWTESAQYDLRFHKHLWELSGNARLASSLRTLLVPYFAYGSIFSVARPDLTPELLVKQHNTYMQYLEGDESQTAEECVRFHLGL